MNMTWTWKEISQFILARELCSKNNIPFQYKMNNTERYCAAFLNPIYRTVEKVIKKLSQRMLIAVVTLVIAIFVLCVFYDFPALVILKIFPYQILRFLFFLYIELIFFCMGCRALGRFNNPFLLTLWNAEKTNKIS